MSPTDLAEMFSEQPSVPLRITMSSGDQVIVNNPALTLVVGLSLHIGVTDDPLSRVGQHLRIVSIPNINLIEPIRPGPSGRRPRRRR